MIQTHNQRIQTQKQNNKALPFDSACDFLRPGAPERGEIEKPKGLDFSFFVGNVFLFPSQNLWPIQLEQVFLRHGCSSPYLSNVLSLNYYFFFLNPNFTKTPT